MIRRCATVPARRLLHCALATACISWAPAELFAQSNHEGGPTAGRQLWLRGDRGVTRGISDLVSAWRDEVTQREVVNWNPTSLPEWRAAEINGRAALHFDGDDFLSGVGLSTGSFTKVAVVQLDQIANVNQVLSNSLWPELAFAGTNRARLIHGTGSVASSTGVSVDSPVVLVATYDVRSGETILFQDGLLVGTGKLLVQKGDGSLLLGGFGGKGSFSGSIAEAMVYDRVLSAGELAGLHTYLLQRYHGDPAAVVRWDELPRPGQLLQRAPDNRASVVVAGHVDSPQWTSLRLEITRDGVLFDTSDQALGFSGGSAPFQFKRMLLAGLGDYELSLYSLRSNECRLVAQVGNIAVGDVWLINGQSNAVAADFHGELKANAESQSHWVRSFGSSSRGPDADSDRHWDEADGDGIYSHCTVGAWGLRLGAQLVQLYAMPIALINGGAASSSIALHQRDDVYPDDPATIYGRLLRRTAAAGVQDRVRGMLWYQGEADASTPAVWRGQWLNLRQAWALDYPALSQIYLFQIRDDCSGDGRELREIQRELIDTSLDTCVMSTTAVPSHDGCHFWYAGYRELGDRLARVLGRDFYGSIDTEEIDPPNLQDAVWYDSAHTQVLLTFRDTNDHLIFDPGAELSFSTDDDVAIQGGLVAGNTVLLQLAGPSNATTISYDGHAFDGPWLQNLRGVGALTFCNVAIH